MDKIFKEQQDEKLWGSYYHSLNSSYNRVILDFVMKEKLWKNKVKQFSKKEIYKLEHSPYFLKNQF